MVVRVVVVVVVEVVMVEVVVRAWLVSSTTRSVRGYEYEFVVGTHMRRLDPQTVNQCDAFPDLNYANYLCDTDYSKGKNGCAPNRRYMGGKDWNAQPGAMVIEWTGEFVKVVTIPSRMPCRA